jgi:hypothetical protein
MTRAGTGRAAATGVVERGVHAASGLGSGLCEPCRRLQLSRGRLYGSRSVEAKARKSSRRKVDISTTSALRCPVSLSQERLVSAPQG